jgi:hypothetical protein
MKMPELKDQRVFAKFVSKLPRITTTMFTRNDFNINQFRTLWTKALDGGFAQSKIFNIMQHAIGLRVPIFDYVKSYLNSDEIAPLLSEGEKMVLFAAFYSRVKI